MLQGIRSKASSLPAKILFAGLVVSFGIWGIGDIFRNRVTGNTVATVGDRKIDARELTQAVREQAERLRPLFGGATLDTEQLKQFGVVDAALQRLINRHLTELEMNHLGLALSSDAVSNVIRANPAFRNDNGVFDPAIYGRALEQQHMSEDQFRQAVLLDLERGELMDALIGGVVPPAQLVDTLYRNRAERRTAEVVKLPPTAVPAPPAPTDADLTAFYDAHKDAFRAPELRSFRIGLLTLDDLAKAVTTPDDKLREAYQNRLSDFHSPEQRHLQQMVLPDEAKAKEAEAKLAAGADFAQVAKEVAGATPDTLDLGFYERDKLPPKLAEAAFSTPQGKVTAPIQDELGWHILRVTEIKPETTQSFDQVKAKLATDLARETAADDMAKKANAIDDALAGGASFDAVTQRFNLKVVKVAQADANGRDAAGKPVELPQPAADILHAAFSSDAGQPGQLNDMGDNGYYLVQVDQVTPPRIKPLDEVREQVTQHWQSEKRDTALAALAKDMADAVNAGKPLAEVAAEHKLTPFASAPLTRSGGDAKVSPALVPKIFETKPGAAVFAKGNDGYEVAQVKDVLPADPAKEGDAVAQLRRQITPNLQQDILQEFDQALRKRYPVSIDSDALARAF